VSERFLKKFKLSKGEQMNKVDLVNEVAKLVSTKKEAQAVVDCVLSSIFNALKKGDTVSLVGFGSFKVVKRKARKGRNPQTGEEIDIQASNATKFTPGKALKEAVN
jgi:DNA-binding protein HU-beta